MNPFVIFSFLAPFATRVFPFVGVVVTFVKTRWPLVLAGLLALVILFGAGAYVGYQYRDGQEAKQEAKAVVIEQESKSERQDSANQIGIAIETKINDRNEKFETIEKKIQRMEPKTTLSSDWVSIYNESTE